MAERWQHRPPGSCWGDYGAGDRLGRLRELTDERVLSAAREIQTGERFCLSLPLDYPGGNVLHPHRHPPVLAPATRNGRQTLDLPLHHAREGALGLVNDDVVTLYTQYSSQWDALGHVGAMFDMDGEGTPEISYFNGHYPAPGVEDMAVLGLQGRGVLVDLERRYGSVHTEVTYAMLAEVMDEQHVTIEPGDILSLHTGMGDALLGLAKAPDAGVMQRCAALDGRDPALLEWIAQSKIAAIVADNFAVEVFPSRPTPEPSHYLPLHELCLFKLGINLGEIWYLGELARRLATLRRSRFFLTAPPLRLPGAVGSPVTPIATI